MVKDIDPKLKKISDYLTLGKNENFEIPEYQREYSWSVEQCLELWQDIENYDSTDSYFFGTIIVDYSDNKTTKLIDGQQRTTTFLLLLKALYFAIKNQLEETNETDKSEALVISLRENRDNIIKILFQISDVKTRLEYLTTPSNFKTDILVNKSMNEPYPEELRTILNSNSYEEAEEAVIHLKPKRKDNKYTPYFKNFKTFFANATALNINLDEFTNKFLNDCQVIEIKSWQQEQAIVMFNSLNSKGLPLSDSNIISATLAAKSKNLDSFKEKWKTIVLLTDELESAKIISLNSLLSEYMYIHRAQDKESDVKLFSVRKYYTETHKELLENPDKFCELLFNLASVWDIIKEKENIKLALKFNDNIKYFLAGFLSRYNENDINLGDIEDIAIGLMRIFTVLEIVDSGYSKKEFKSFLFKLNLKLVNKSIPVREIILDIDEHIDQNWIKKELKSNIFDYKKNILVFLNEFLFSKEKGITFILSQNIQIEHIMPSSGRNIQAVRENSGMDSEEFDDYVNKLGNKILLESKFNQAIGNDWFQTKQDTYSRSQFPLAQSLATYKSNQWTKADIDEAEKKIIYRIVKFIFND